MRTVKPTVMDRFLVANENNWGACWEWPGASNGSGYGRVSVGPGKAEYVHRHVYELIVGLIPPGLDLDHLCRNRSCGNPLHLDPVTRGENVRRSPIAPAAVNARKTHCKWGHEFTPENTTRDARGRRGCRTCRHDRHVSEYVPKDGRLVSVHSGQQADVSH